MVSSIEAEPRSSLEDETNFRGQFSFEGHKHARTERLCCQPARNTTVAAEIIDPNVRFDPRRILRPPPPRGVPTLPASRNRRRYFGDGCRRRKPVVRGTQNFSSEKEGAWSEKKTTTTI